MKVVLITGASSGLGKSIGEYLHNKGYKVYGTSRSPQKYSDSKFPLLALDVRNKESIDSCVREILSKESRIDVLVNNAGVGIIGALEEIPTEEIRNHFEVNLFGPVEVMKSVLPTMRAQKSGYVINVTSIAGYTGLPYRAVYSASKGALELLTEGLRMEVKPFGVKVCCLAPGEFATNIADGRYYAPKVANSDYAETYDKTLNLINSHVSGGDDPILVAQQIDSILQDSDPKIHYKVGPFLSKFSIVLKRILPDKMYENMLMKHYKLK